MVVSSSAAAAAVVGRKDFIVACSVAIDERRKMQKRRETASTGIPLLLSLKIFKVLLNDYRVRGIYKLITHLN